MNQRTDKLLGLLWGLCVTCLIILYSGTETEISYDEWQGLLKNGTKIEYIKTTPTLQDLLGKKMLYFRLHDEKLERCVNLKNESRLNTIRTLQATGISRFCIDDPIFGILIYATAILSISLLARLVLKFIAKQSEKLSSPE